VSRSGEFSLIGLAASDPSSAIDAAAAALKGDGARVGDPRPVASRRFHAITCPIAGSRSSAWQEMTRSLRPLQARLGVDLAVVPSDPERRAPKVLVMDMDSTLVQSEGIDELAKEAGVGEQVSAITRRAMNGELDFRGALKERVGLLRGLSAEALSTVHARTYPTPGAEILLDTLRKVGCALAVVSGGFDYFTERLKNRLGLDHALANRLEVEGGRLTGRLVGDIVDGTRKAAMVEELARVYGVALDRVVAIGDGANDLPMLGRAGLGVAFCAKPTVREAAPVTVSVKDLSAVLCFLGYDEREFAHEAKDHR
jgi:phosphoserine phosphatase